MWSFHCGGFTPMLVLLPLILISVIACTLSFFLLNLLGEVEDLSLHKHLEAQNPVYSLSDDQNRKGAILQVNTVSLNGGNDSIIKTKIIRRYSKLEMVEACLVKAREAIKEAARNRNLTSIHEDPDYVPQGPIYRNANAFHRSYLEMERVFKIYVYKEGEQPMFHNGPCKSIYSTPGRLIHEIEKGSLFITEDPEEALVYFLPFSVVMMVQYLYVPGAKEYRGPHTTSYVPNLFNNSIRVLCNANTSEGFNPKKDVSLPEIHLRSGEITGLVGGPSPSKRPILAFFAGRLHGHIRYLLLEQWKEKDHDVQVYDSLPKGVSYETMLRTSRFCLCPSGYEQADFACAQADFACIHEIEVIDMNASFVDPRRTLRKSEVLTNYHVYHNDKFVDILEKQVEELNDRFGEIGTDLLLGMSCLDPQNSFRAFDKEKLIKFAKFYPFEFSPMQIIELEWALPVYLEDVSHDDRFSTLNGITGLGKQMVETGKHLIHPLVYLLIKLAMLLPVATAGVERSFSAMNIVKTRLRNRLGDEWLNDILVTYVERDVFLTVKIEDVLQRFQNMKPRRIAL